MKKLISLVLALVLSLSLIACGAKQDDTPQAGADTPDRRKAEAHRRLRRRVSAVRLHRR